MSKATIATLEIAVFIGVVVADALGLVPITQTIFLVPLILLALRLQGQPIATIGFSLPANFWRTVALGIFAGIVIELIALFLTTPLIIGVFGVEPDYSELRELEGNLSFLLFLLLFSWVVAAIGEEMCFRGFLMHRTASLFGDGRTAWAIALVLTSVLFGWGHTEQGVAGWVQEGLAGFWLGCLFLLAKRNLVLPIVAHGVSNTIALTLIYFGRYPGMG